MEQKPDPKGNIEHARVMAEAAKPLIDVAREEWVNEDEKKTLDEMAIKRGEIALNKELLRGENSNTEIKSDNKERVNKILEIIENSPNIQFIVGGRGNLTNKQGGSTSGFQEFYFDSKSKEMLGLNNANRGFNLDENVRAKHWTETLKLDKKGVPQFDIRLANDGYMYIIKRLPFENNSKNLNILSDLRQGLLAFTTAIRYKMDDLSSIDDETIKQELREPKDANFINEVLDAYANKYIQNYYNFILETTKKD